MIAATQSQGWVELIFGVVWTVVMLSPFWLPIVCGVIGSLTEKRHYESIRVRERASARVPVIPTPLSDDSRIVVNAVLVTGAMVVSPDAFRRFLASVRNVFGGRLRSYESMLDRARREAVLRMKEQAPGADAIVNFRMETSQIGGQQKKQGIIAIEVLAYGTALTYGDRPGQSISAPPPLP